MNEKHTQSKDADPEQYHQMTEDILMQVVAKGGGTLEVTGALNTVGLTNEAALNVIYALIDRGLVVLDASYKLQLTEEGAACILKKGAVSETIIELADTIVERKTRMRLLGQQLLESVKDSY